MAEKSPLVSVVIPSFNRADLVLDSIQSVWDQSYTNFELIVIDDGSSDNTRELLAPFAKQGLLKYAYQKNAGLPAARNHGIRLANGELIAFLDSDDLFLPEKLEKQVRYLDEHPNASIVHSWFSKFSEQVDDLGLRNTSWFSGDIYPQILLQWSVLMAVPCVMLRREVFDKVGQFNESLRWAEDLDLWRRVARHYAFHVIPESLVRIRVHPNSMSSDKSQGAKHFGIVLQEAFADDPGLTAGFQNKAWASMYTNVAHNLLGQGRAQDMGLVRKYALNALVRSPLKLSALLALPASLLPSRLRNWLAQRLRKSRYPAKRL